MLTHDPRAMEDFEEAVDKGQKASLCHHFGAVVMK